MNVEYTDRTTGHVVFFEKNIFYVRLFIYFPLPAELAENKTITAAVDNSCDIIIETARGSKTTALAVVSAGARSS